MPVFDDDVFGSLFSSNSISGHVADDGLLGGRATSYAGLDDLISGFGRQQERAETTVSSEDPFAVFEKSSTTNSSVFETLDNLGKTSIRSPQSGSSPYETNATASDLFSKNYSHLSATNEAFFTIDDSPLFTMPSKAPPSLRPPPPPGTKLESYGTNNLGNKGKDQCSRTSTINPNGSVQMESVSQIDELEEFARGKPQPNGNDLVTKKANERKKKLDREKEARERDKNKLEKGRATEDRKNKQYSGANAGEKASAGSQQHKHTNSDDIFFPQTQSSGSANAAWQASSKTNFMDDLIFGFGGSASGEEFQEVEGESEDRRRARLERHQRTHERTKQALAEKQERDMQTQMEQEEKHRINETLDAEIRNWAAGKEGNLRALLSTLQYVLWPECGWQPVSLIDLITSAAVKKVYRKATLNLHPDKLHRATLQQKCIGEKVFDILKEAYNKFNAEEL